MRSKMEISEVTTRQCSLQASNTQGKRLTIPVSLLEEFIFVAKVEDFAKARADEVNALLLRLLVLLLRIRTELREQTVESLFRFLLSFTAFVVDRKLKRGW